MKAYFSVAQFAVKVLVDFLDHVLEAQVGLRSSQFLHHQLQLHQVNEAVLTGVKPTETQEDKGFTSTHLFEQKKGKERGSRGDNHQYRLTLYNVLRFLELVSESLWTS